MNSYPISPPPSPGSEDNWNLEEEVTISTDRSLSPLTDPDDLPMLSESSAPLRMRNSPDPPPPSPTFSRTRRQLFQPDSNWDSDPETDALPPTGNPSGTLPSLGTSPTFLTIYEYVITVPSEELQRTTCILLLWNESSTSFGDRLVLENLGTLGTQRVWTLTLKILSQNFGTAIMVRSTLLSMSFVELSVSPISYGGSIGTRSLWRSRALPLPW